MIELRWLEREEGPINTPAGTVVRTVTVLQYRGLTKDTDCVNATKWLEDNEWKDVPVVKDEDDD